MIALVVEAALRSLALGLVVWLALTLVRPRNPHLHKTVWITVVLASIAMPFLIELSVAPSVPAPTYIVSLQSGTAAIVSSPTNWTLGASVLYAMVVLALLVRFATAFLRMWRLKRKATVLREPWTQSDDVRVSLKLHTPATFGSTILLPPEFWEWSEQKLAAVMSHERSHVRRKDCYILWIARLHTCLFWINPLAWWIQGRLAALAETTSDDAVVAELGDRPAYAEVLLEIASTHPHSHRAVAAAEMAASRALVVQRIERIISEIAPSVVPKPRYQALAIALLLPIVVGAAATLESDMEPRILEAPYDEKFYPPEAARRGIEGFVIIAISLDAAGRPNGTLILDEHPLDAGFGAAASALVHTFKYSNPSKKPTQLSIKVKFDLKDNANAPPAYPDSFPPAPDPAGG